MDEPSLTANATISHYRIVSRIAAGGMGVVYLAQDTRLDRTVVLKILPDALRTGWGTFFGRMAGMILKFVIAIMVALAVAIFL